MLVNVLISIAIPLAACILANVVRLRSPAWVAMLIVVVGWWLALGVGQWFIAGLIWPPSQFWQRLWLPLGLLVVCAPWLTISTLRFNIKALPYFRLAAVSALAGCITAYALPNSDEASASIFERVIWGVGVVIATVVNGVALLHLDHQPASRWSMWILVASLGAAAIQAGAVYGSLATWCMVATVATAVVALAHPFAQPIYGRPLFMPASCLCANLIAMGRFYSYQLQPASLYILLLFFPAAVILCERWLLHRRTFWPRFAFAAIVSGIYVASMLWVFWIRPAESM